MNVPEWVSQFFRKQPKNFTGCLEIHCKNGGVTGIRRHDFWNQEIFYTRYKEERLTMGESDATRSTDVAIDPIGSRVSGTKSNGAARESP